MSLVMILGLLFQLWSFPPNKVIDTIIGEERHSRNGRKGNPIALVTPKDKNSKGVIGKGKRGRIGGY